MEVLAPQQLKETNQEKKRTQCPGIRVMGGRIYDSENGVCCHQCRQKTRDFAASCKNVKGVKLCTIKFCHKCLLNRYGEKAEEVDVLNDWKCPKCRGICNCSLCMKRRGHQPTGQLVREAKASGFSSVSEMLDVKGPNNITSTNIQNVAVSPIKAASSKKDLMIDLNSSNSDMEVKSNAVSSKMPVGSDGELVVALLAKHGKENSLDRNSSLNSDSQNALLDSKERPRKTKREGLKEIRNSSRVNDACQYGNTKRVKICNEVPFEETKQNATDDIIQAGKKRNKMQQKMKVSRTSNDVSLNSDEKYVKEETNKQNCKDIVNPENKEMNNAISLPMGSVLTGIQDLELPPEDVGHALQFLEFSTAFEKTLDIKKGEAEAILEELCIQSAPSRRKTLVVQFYNRLLTLILSESEDGSPFLKSKIKHSWWEALRNIISESAIVRKGLQLDGLQEGIDGYYNLNLSNKLKLLNFLCDEALGTESIRSFIDEQQSKFAESAKEAKIKVAEAKEKERSLRQKMKDDVAKATIGKNGAPLSITEHEDLVREIKNEAARAHAKMLEAKGLVPKTQERSDAVRTAPELVDSCGRAFWRLKCYPVEYAVLMQEIKFQDDAAADERWFVYGTEQKHDIEAYITWAKRLRI